MSTAHVSGHLNLTEEEFQTHYVPQLEAALAAGDSFVVGDARGADARAQQWLWDRLARVHVFHMHGKPRNNVGFPTRGGYATDDERDAAMTEASDKDIAWVRPGRENSGTARNIARRSTRGQAR